MDIFEYFGSFTRLPVTIDDIAGFMLERQYIDRIFFHPVKVESAILHALYHRVDEISPPYAPDREVRVAHIYYAKDLDLQSRRIAVCKELVHVLDGEGTRALSTEEIGTLISQVVLPFDIQNANRAAIWDRFAIINALRLLFPRDALEAFLPFYEKGEVTAEELSILAEIPEMYVRFLMTPQWQTILDAMENNEN
jgi:hypothetical protein